MKSDTSLTVRAIGPLVAIGIQRLLVGTVGTRPPDGRKPTTLQNEAGFRSDPPKSEPSAMGSMRAARATAAPPLLPPQVLEVSYGFDVTPNTSLNV